MTNLWFEDDQVIFDGVLYILPASGSEKRENDVFKYKPMYGVYKPNAMDGEGGVPSGSRSEGPDIHRVDEFSAKARRAVFAINFQTKVV